MKSPAITDQKVEQVLGTLLQAGVILSGTIVLIGGILYLFHNGHNPASYHVFAANRPSLGNLSAIVSNAFHFDGRAIIQLGLLLLIATPVVRVIFSVAAFWLERDRTYVLFTLIVLAVLLYSLFLGQ
jgi:uncharacterized membrane protein